MSWQHKEPSDFVPVPALAPLSHEPLWFNMSGFRHRWLIARPNVFYEQSAGSYIGLICVIMPSKNANVNFNNWHVIFSYFSLLLKHLNMGIGGLSRHWQLLKGLYHLLTLTWLMPSESVFILQDFMHYFLLMQPKYLEHMLPFLGTFMLNMQGERSAVRSSTEADLLFSSSSLVYLISCSRSLCFNLKIIKQRIISREEK